MSEAQQIIAIEDISADNAPTIFVAGGLSRFIESVKSEVCGEVPDLTTRKGRERIASLSATVSKRKTAIEKPGRDYLRHIKTLPKVVEDELREFVTSMNALRDEVRKPLDDWQAAEDARVDRHSQGIEWFRLRADENSELDAAELNASIAEVESRIIDESWEEFEAEAHRIKARALASLKEALEKRVKADSEAAELLRLRQEAEARAEADRIAEAQRVAVEAERQRVEQERREQQEESDRLIRKAELEREQARIDQEQAELRTKQAERDRIAAVEQAERDRVAAEERAEQRRIQAENLAEQERLAANERKKRAEEKARQDEIDRQQREADEIERQRRARESDQPHKIKIMGEAKQAIMGMNVSEELAKAIVLKIARGEVPNVKINF